MGPPRLITIEEARERVLAAVEPLPAEEAALGDALGRFLADDVTAAEALPPFDTSAMDGFAVATTTQATLAITGESRAGAPLTDRLATDSAARISTGAVPPPGTVRVVPVERTNERDGLVEVPAGEEGANVRRAGEDVRPGDRVMARGRRVGAPELAVLASLGYPTVPCTRQPRTAVLTTGDELVEPGSPLGPGQIRNSNAYGLAALVSGSGGLPLAAAPVPDDRDGTTEAIARALAEANVLCVTGGVSVGAHDHVKAALAELGVEERFWGVALQPGKPTWFGTKGDQLVFGLPGNPVSALVTYLLFARPAVLALQGGDPYPTRASATIDSPLRRKPERAQAVRVRLEPGADGWHAAPTKDQGSHVLTSMLDADALAFVPAGEGELGPGERVDIELL